MFRAEVGRRVVRFDSSVSILTEEHKLRQTLVKRPQAVVHPRADYGLFLVERVAPVMHLKLGIVVVVSRIHRAHDRNIIDALRQVRKPITDLSAGSTVTLVANLQREDCLKHLGILTYVV